MLMVRKIALARRLRQTQTAPEELLWSHLRARRLGGFKFRRQAPLDRYVVDFLSTEAKLVVEIDGPSHEASVAQDRERKRMLEAKGSHHAL
jgi:very-short-patch-repair endonuclease